MNRGVDIIHCIGDSHVDVFSGNNTIQPEWPDRVSDKLPLFHTYRLGAVLAFNISDKNHPTYLKLQSVLKTLPKESIVMLVAGEVDCRVHLVKQSIQQGRTIRKITTDCVNKYFKLLLELKKRGFKVIACGPISTTPYSIADKDYPTRGSFKQRNIATRVFNSELEKLSLKHSIAFVSVYNDLYSKGKVNTGYYIDPIHLSTKALPLYYKKLTSIRFINKQLLLESQNTRSTDLMSQTIKRKALYFALIQSKFYPIAQKCLTFIKNSHS